MNVGSGTRTGSGKSIYDFDINEYGWYTYDNKIVVATATRYLLNYGYRERDNITYYKYYDTFKLLINGEEFEAIVLDSCGAAMVKNIIDLFVVDKSSVIDTTITLIEE